MQAGGSVSWVVQASVLGRCGGASYSSSCCYQEKSRLQAFGVVRCGTGSQEKKPRVRKTKEERREMVESFITTYRSSNNGKFPSLNLTHKEVGGSFYIVREIVRDIIQENRVLGPGDMNLESLSFDDCPEPSHLSITHEIDENNIEMLDTTCYENQDDKSSGLKTSDSEKVFPSQKNVMLTQQPLGSSNILEVGFLNSVVQNDNVVDATCIEKDLVEQNRVPLGNSRVYELNRSQKQVPSVARASDSDQEMELGGPGDVHENTTSVTDGAVFSLETTDVSQTTGPLSLQEHETVPNDDHDNTTNSVADGAVFSLETTDVSQTTGPLSLQEHETVPNDDHDNMTNSVADEASLSSETNGTLYLQADKILTEIGTGSDVQITDDGNHSSVLASVQTEASNFSTNNLGTVDPAKDNAMSEIQRPLDEFDQPLPDASPHSISSSCISTQNIKEQGNLNGPVSPATLETKGSVQMEDKYSTVEEDESKFKKSLSTTLKEKNEADNTKHEHQLSTTTAISRRTAESAQQKRKTNPFWLIIRTFVHAVIKFWTE